MWRTKFLLSTTASTAERCEGKTLPEAQKPLAEDKKRFDKKEDLNRWVRAEKKAAAMVRCPNCDYQGQGKKFTPGNFAIEVILWLFMVLPGLIYSIWRLANKKLICPVCDWQHVAPLAAGTATPSDPDPGEKQNHAGKVVPIKSRVA